LICPYGQSHFDGHPRLQFRCRKDSFLAKPKGAWWEVELRRAPEKFAGNRHTGKTSLPAPSGATYL